MASVYFILTKNCNYRCDHCFVSGEPGLMATTISQTDFEKAVQNFPANGIGTYLKLTGGEIFTIKHKLYNFLDFLQEENVSRKQEGKGTIKVKLQTNGFWARREETTEKILDELVSKGVLGLDITSHDKYHQAQGADFKKLEVLEKLAQEKFREYDVELRGANNLECIAPVGRGKQVFDESKFNLYCSQCRFENEITTILPDGSVYSCCFFQSRLPRNILEEPLMEIIERAKQDERLNILAESGVSHLAEHDGHDFHEMRDFENHHGNCGVCFKMYPNGISQPASKLLPVVFAV